MKIGAYYHGCNYPARRKKINSAWASYALGIG